jgi:hypothetical protein
MGGGGRGFKRSRPQESLVLYKSVFRIRIHMFLGLQDPDPDPLVRGMDLDPDSDPSIISKKNLDSFYFMTLFDFLSLKNDIDVPSKSNRQKKLC